MRRVIVLLTLPLLVACEQEPELSLADQLTPLERGDNGRGAESQLLRDLLQQPLG